jgi:hypothetical protein
VSFHNFKTCHSVTRTTHTSFLTWVTRHVQLVMVVELAMVVPLLAPDLLASTLYEGKHKVLNIASIKGCVCKTQIDTQPLINVQSSNRHPMTYVLNTRKLQNQAFHMVKLKSSSIQVLIVAIITVLTCMECSNDPMTYVLNNVTPVMAGFWSNEGSCQEIKDIPSRGKVFVVKNINEGSCQEIKDIPSRGKVFVIFRPGGIALLG